MVGDTRARLLQAAWVCVRANGMAGATSRAITDEAEANLGSITYYFGSKDALVAHACVGAIRDLVRPAVIALGRDDLEPTVRVIQAVGLLQQAFASSTQDAPALLEVLVHSRQIPLLQHEMEALFAELRGALARTMADQKADGYLPQWVVPDAMAGLLLAVAQGVVLHATIDTPGPPLSAMVTQFTQLLIAARGDGIEPNTGGTPRSPM